MKNKSILSGDDCLILLGIFFFNAAIYNGGRLISRSFVHHDLTTILDIRIPFLSWTIVIYWGCYLFWVINYYIGVKYDKQNGFALAHFIGETICFISFVFFPTTMKRAVVTGDTLFDLMVRMTYFHDAADNLLPSIHCFASWLCWIGVRKNDHVYRWYKILSFIMAAAVCASTLTVKQHVLADVIAGILLAEGSYALAGKIKQQKV